LDPELRRSQIVEAAVRVFSETDPVEVTFEEIAEAAGVSRALVYNWRPADSRRVPAHLPRAERQPQRHHRPAGAAG
jgi:hypothetical protein